MVTRNRPILGVILLLTVMAGSSTAVAEPWTLERAIAYALDNSPTAKIASERIALANADLQKTRATFWPTWS
ncbi:MAG: hypothetical protein R3C68_04005 [Myxococcota bacterium]